MKVKIIQLDEKEVRDMFNLSLDEHRKLLKAKLESIFNEAPENKSEEKQAAAVEQSTKFELFNPMRGLKKDVVHLSLEKIDDSVYLKAFKNGVSMEICSFHDDDRELYLHESIDPSFGFNVNGLGKIVTY